MTEGYQLNVKKTIDLIFLCITGTLLQSAIFKLPVTNVEAEVVAFQNFRRDTEIQHADTEFMSMHMQTPVPELSLISHQCACEEEMALGRSQKIQHSSTSFNQLVSPKVFFINVFT